MPSRRFRTLAVALPILLVAHAAGALELSRAETSAQWVVPSERIAPYLELNFGAELGAVESTDGAIAMGWAPPGILPPRIGSKGIDPTPFRIVIPAACLLRDSGSLLVRAHRACGVRAELVTSEGRALALPLLAFTAVLTERRGFARLSVSAALGVQSEVGDVTSDLLGILGGATQVVAIGDASSSLLPNEIGIRGFNPQPEPPALVF